MHETVVTLGVDIGGTNTKYGFVDSRGNYISGGWIRTNGHEPAETLVERLHQAIEAEYRGLGETYRWVGIGIGAPNANFFKGTVEHPPNLDWDVVPLVSLVQRFYNLPIAITNDANAAAIGEMVYGAARNMRDFIAITLGTGLGSGIVVNGQVVYGWTGKAGELGHTTAVPDGRTCGCGKDGCLETYVSATGLCRTVRDFLESEAGQKEKITGFSALHNGSSGELTSEKIAEAARAGDGLALKAFDFTARILAMRLADAVAITSPQAIFLGGGLANSGDLIFEPTRKYLEQFLPPFFRNTVKLLPSALQEQNAAILGASALILEQLGKVGI